MISYIFYLRKEKLVLTQFVVFQSSHKFNYFNIKHFLKKIVACASKRCMNKLKIFRGAGNQKGWEPLV